MIFIDCGELPMGETVSTISDNPDKRQNGKGGRTQRGKDLKPRGKAKLYLSVEEDEFIIIIRDAFRQNIDQ